MWCRKRRWNEPLSRLRRQLPFQGSLWWAVIVVSPNRGDAPQGAEGFHSVRRTPILFFRQYRIIRQGDLARNFSSQICCENAGILCVFQVFTADLWGKRTVKARRCNCAVLPYRNCPPFCMNLIKILRSVRRPPPAPSCFAAGLFFQIIACFLFHFGQKRPFL